MSPPGDQPDDPAGKPGENKERAPEASRMPSWLSPTPPEPSLEVPPADRPPPWAPPLEHAPAPFQISRSSAWAPPSIAVDAASPASAAPSPASAADVASSAAPWAASVPALGAGKPQPSDPPPERTTLGWFRDNLEAFAFAILLALLLRHLCIEVFKIPTRSMEPTLFGKNSGQHPGTEGDRIAVDKMSYLLRGPSRWDVAVFRFPLDWTRNFIKRVTGLPGEHLRIERGDVWIAPPGSAGLEPEFHPARKPKRVREQLYVPVYPPKDTSAAHLPSSFWRDDTAGGTGFSPFASFREFPFPGDRETAGGPDAAPATIRYAYPIFDESRADAEPSPSDREFPTPDVRVRGTLETTGPADFVLEWRPGDGRVHTLSLASKGRGESFASTATERRSLEALPEKRRIAFEFESVDGDLRVTLDDDEVAVLRDETTIAAAQTAERAKDATAQKLSMRAAGAPFVIRDVRVDHDLYYTNHVADPRMTSESGDAWRIPDDAYFMMGDNTRNSNDSRLWTASGVTLKNGMEVWFDPSPSSDEDEVRYPKYSTIDGVSYQERRDVEGVVRRWSDADVMPGKGMTSKRVPFVTRERIVGQAWFAMYADFDVWPLKVPRIRTDGRIRFIH